MTVSDEEQRARAFIRHEDKRDAYVTMGLPDPGPLQEAMPGPPAEKNLDWLRDEIVTLFQDAKTTACSPGDDAKKMHAICVKYAEILSALLPGGAASAARSSNARNDAHPDANLIEAVRRAVQGVTP